MRCCECSKSGGMAAGELRRTLAEIPARVDLNNVKQR
jgi:hypothetical protein